MTVHTDPTALHAVYAPSSSHRWTECTASAEAIARLPEQEEGEEAAEGTAAHEEIERCFSLAERAGTSPRMVLDFEHPAAYGIALVIDFVKQLTANKTVDDRLWIEQRVALTDQIWGRCDVAHWHAESRTLTIVDYKNGQRAVDADENPQLRIYAAAVMFTKNLPVKWIRYVVVQPNDWRPFVPRVKQWSESVDALYSWVERVANIPTQPKSFTAGEHCRNCPLFGKCSASQDLLANLGAVIAGLVSPDSVRPEQVALFLATQKPIEDAFKGFARVWQKKALGGAVPEAMKIVATRPHRAWLNEDWAREFVVKRFGVEKLLPPTPAQVEELGATEAEINGLSHRPEGGPVLAFANDKRKPWAQKSVAEMFKDVKL